MTNSKPLEWGEVEDWRAPSNDLKAGWFSAIDPLAWEGCRERFSATMKKPGFKSFYIVHDEGASKNVASFIHKTEVLLGLSEMTTFNKTSCSAILRINMSDFWTTYVKRSLFTILARLGNGYNVEKDNYESLMFAPSKQPAHGYNSTVPAVKRFLYGFTTYDAPDPEYSTGTTLETTGWCKLFYRPNSWRKLIKPANKKVSPIAIGKLWG